MSEPVPPLAPPGAPLLAPYVGVRSYGFDEQAIFTGRDADVEQLCHLVANRDRWRILLLHGQTGCGKSSLLKAGLIPELTPTTGLDTAVYRQDGGRSASQFITSTEDPMRRLAEVAVALVRDHIPTADQAGWLAELDFEADLDAALLELAATPAMMAQWFAALARRLQRALLLVVDQAEEVFTLRSDHVADVARSRYFDFLAAFCERQSWIQLLISMRTEFYGRFENELRQRLGASMPVAPYYLEPFLLPMLERAVTEPLAEPFHSGTVTYRVTFEDGVPRLIAWAVAQRFPGPGALTGLQIVCQRLWERALHKAGPANAQNAGGHALPRVQDLAITLQMFHALGNIANVIEDVVDQAIGDFCDKRELRLIEADRLWWKTKFALGTLVTQQPGAAPTTKFIERDRFVGDLAEQVLGKMPVGGRWVWQSLGVDTTAEHQRDLAKGLVDYLVRPQVRILREVETVADSAERSTVYLGLGHDVISIGLVDAMARTAVLDRRDAAQGRRSLWQLGVWTTAIGGICAALPWLSERLDFGDLADVSPWISAGMGAMATIYGVGFFELIRSKPDPIHKLLEGHMTNFAIVRSTERLPWMLSLTRLLEGVYAPFKTFRFAFIPLRSTGMLFREITAEARNKAAEAGATAFPGGPRT